MIGKSISGKQSHYKYRCNKGKKQPTARILYGKPDLNNKLASLGYKTTSSTLRQEIMNVFLARNEQTQRSNIEAKNESQAGYNSSLGFKTVFCHLQVCHLIFLFSSCVSILILLHYEDFTK